MKSSGNTILMTGGGSGIGEALAHRLHDRGDTVIVAARSTDALERACAGRERMHAIELDVADPTSIRRVADAVVADHPALNVLINNAGIMRYEPLDRPRDLADAEATVVTNLLGPIRMTDALIGHLTGRADAAIVNVTSGLAFVPLAGAATYCATKAAIHSWTVSLREALADRVEVIEIAPPGVQTALTPGQEDIATAICRSTPSPMRSWGCSRRQPTPARRSWSRGVRPLRSAEADGQFAERLQMLNDQAAARTREVADLGEPRRTTWDQPLAASASGRGHRSPPRHHVGVAAASAGVRSPALSRWQRRQGPRARPCAHRDTSCRDTTRPP